MLFKSALTMGAAMLALTATAYEVTPPQGFVNMAAYPEGVNSVEILGNLSINREAEGYITLIKNNEVIRQIPASNLADLYTFMEYNKTEKGDVHITFWGVNGPGKEEGSYKMTVPAGFFTDGGSPTEAMEYKWTINTASYPISPAPGSYTSLKEFRLTLPTSVSSATRTETITGYQVSGQATLEPLFDPDGNAINLDISLDGNTAILSLPQTFTDKDIYVLKVDGGAFTFTTESNRKVSSKEVEYRYEIEADSKNTVEILPAPGEYAEFAPVRTTIGDDTFDYTFLITTAADDPIQFVLMGQAKLYPMNEDGTYSTDTNAGSFRPIKKGSNCIALVPTTGADKTVSPTPGRYALEIPSNLYQTASGRNGKYFFEYTVTGSDHFKYTVTPSSQEPIEKLSEVTITFNADDIVALRSKTSYATLTNGIAVYTMTGTVSDETPNAITFALTRPLAEAGKWTFTTPATGLTVNGSEFSCVREFQIGDHVTIETVEAIDGNVEVYTIAGVRVAEGELARMATTLPAGIYVAVSTETRKAVKFVVK